MRGIWWRRRLAVAVLLVGTVVMGAAVLGPLYARAAGESTLRDELTQAGTETGLEFQDVPYEFDLTTSVSHFDLGQAATPRPGAVRGYPTRIPSIQVQTKATAPGSATVRVGMLWRPGACSQLIIVAGHCPTGPGQVLVSARTVDGGYGWRLGGRLTFAIGTTLRIVGIYTPRDSQGAFWFGHDYFEEFPSSDGPDWVDQVFVDRAATRALPPHTQATLAWDYPLDPSAIRLKDVGRLRRDVAALQRRYRSAGPCNFDCSGEPVHLQVSTGLSKVLDAAARQRELVDRGTLLVTLQLALLAWLVLFEVVTDAVEARGNELALAKLRGLRPWWTARFALSEPLLVLAVAAPIGLGLGWTAAELFSSAVLAPNTPVVLTWSAAAALASGFAGGVVASVAACHRALHRSVLAQWRRTLGSPPRSHVGLAIDLSVSAAAIAGLVWLSSSGGAAGSAALLAPGLLVTAAALLGARALPVLTRTLLRPTRASGRIGLFLATRQVARRPAGLRLAALLAVAVGLATFGVIGESVAASNRTARAHAEIGADRTVAVQFVRGVDPVAAVRKADPAGRWAMAAATWLPDGGGSIVGTVLALDASRLARVGYAASGGPSTARMASVIGSSAVDRVDTSSPRLRVLISASSVHGAPPQVQFVLRTARAPFLSVDAGTIRPGTHTYTAPVDCATGCMLLGLAWNRDVTYDGTMSGRLLVHRIEQDEQSKWVPVGASLTDQRAWRANPVSESSDSLHATPGGLVDDYRSRSGFNGVTYAFAPQPLPVIATHAGVAGGAETSRPRQMIDQLGITATFTVAHWAPALPVVLDTGLIADLNDLRALRPGFDTEANWTVWIGPRAPSDALARLRATGLTLQRVRSTSSRIVQLGRQAPALSLFLLLACAIVGSVVAVGGTATAISASARRRSFETAALRVVGVPRSALYRGGVLEQLILLGAAVLLGIPAGALAARLAMPVIPEFADTTPILLHYRPPALPIVAFAAAFTALVGLASMIAAAAVLRSAVPTRLRGTEE
ncbi:MAG: FtsX-like permease family protein [Jatrophihabitans sp.]|uniref:FtsX-like permease family protein n=1 Tax=Jatrophihabitans sp. TaxID=1932789 RepID=UPI003F80E954